MPYFPHLIIFECSSGVENPTLVNEGEAFDFGQETAIESNFLKKHLKAPNMAHSKVSQDVQFYITISKPKSNILASIYQHWEFRHHLNTPSTL